MKSSLAVLILALFSGVLGAQEYVPRNAKLFIEEGRTADVSGKLEDRSDFGDFGMAIAAAMHKKKVPVTILTDKAKADFEIQHDSTRDEDSSGVKIAKSIFGWGGGVKFEGVFTIIDQETSAIVFSYNVKKNNFQSAAEAFAKHLKNHIEKGVKETRKRR